MTDMDGRMPPGDIAAEAALLGELMMWPETADDVAFTVASGDHLRPAHQMIHEAILSVRRQGVRVDPIAVADELRRRGQLGTAGGLDYLHTLAHSAVVPQSAEHHARIVAECARRRELAGMGVQLQDLALNPGAGLDDIEALAQRIGTERRSSGATLAERYEPVDWEAAWKEQPEDVEWLIEPFIEAGTLNVLYAKTGTGKSLLTLEWALSLARRDYTVVYVDNENRVRDHVERLQAMGAHPSELSRLMLYSFAGLPPLDTAAGGQHLTAIAAAAGAALVVIDTASRFVEGGDNDTDTYVRLDRHTGASLKSHGIASLRLSHPGKDETRGQAGSSAKSTDVDTVWKLTEVASGRRYRMSREKNRTGHAPGADALDVERKYGPLRHAWTVPDRSAEMTLLGQLCGQLDALKVPPSAGRDRCRTALNEAGVAISNEQLARLVRYRKTVPDSSRTGDALVPGLSDLSPSPPPRRGGDGQDSPHRSATATEGNES